MTIVAAERTIKTYYILGGGLILSGLALNLFLFSAVSKPLEVNGWIVAGCGDALILLGLVSLIIGKIKDRQLQKKIKIIEKEKAALKIQRWFRKPLNQLALSQDYYYKHPSTKKPKLRKFTIVEAETSEQREKIKQFLEQNQHIKRNYDGIMREAEILHKAQVISDEEFGSIKRTPKYREPVGFLCRYIQKHHKKENFLPLAHQIYKFANLSALQQLSQTYLHDWNKYKFDIMKYAIDDEGLIHSVIIIDREQSFYKQIHLLLSSPTNIDKTNEMRVDGSPTALLVSAAMDYLRWARSKKQGGSSLLFELEPSIIAANYYEHLGFKTRLTGDVSFNTGNPKKFMYIKGYSGLRNFILRHGGRAQVALS